MGSPAAFAATGRLEAYVPPSQARPDESGKKSGALRLARTPPCGPHHRAAGEKRLVEEPAWLPALGSFIPIEPYLIRTGRAPFDLPDYRQPEACPRSCPASKLNNCKPPAIPHTVVALRRADASRAAAQRKPDRHPRAPAAS